MSLRMIAKAMATESATERATESASESTSAWFGEKKGSVCSPFRLSRSLCSIP